MRNTRKMFFFAKINKRSHGDVKVRFGNIAKYILVLSALSTQTGTRAHHLDEFRSKKRGGDYVLLSLIGYNYTDRHISDYSVSGAGGGHINLSSATSGGSGQACCVRLSRVGGRTFLIKVRWQVDGCKYVERDPRTGATDEIRHFYYKEMDVNVQRMDDQNPGYIETHFYADGSIKVRLTEMASEPILSLDETRPDKSSFSRCKNDEQPEQ